jgi:MFS family permease
MSSGAVDSSGETEQAQRPESGILTRPYRRLTLGLVSVILLVAFEGMAVATAMPVAVRDLAGLSLYAWSFSGFFVASLYAMVLAGDWCDRRGPSRPIVVGALTFVAGLVIAGVAPTMWPFIAGRATQGFGAGFIIVALYVVVARAYPDAVRPRVFSALSAAWVLPSIIGPTVAGAIAENASWRLVFLGLVPLVVPALVLVLPGLHRYDEAANAAGRRRGRVWLAAAAAVGVAALQYAGVRLDFLAIGIAVVGVVLTAISVPRLLPQGTLRFRRGLPTVVAMRGVLAGAFFGAEAFLPLMLVQQRGVSATQAGLSLTGGALGWALGSWYQGRPRLPLPRHRLIQAGAGFVTVGIVSALLVLIPAVPAALAIPAWAVGAFGMGLGMSSISVLLFEYSAVEDQGVNSAAVQLADALGSIGCIGLSGVIFAFAHARAADVIAFLVIFAAMAMLATLGAMLAGRAGRPRRQEHS